MKKLFALAIVAGMMFASCGNNTENNQEEVAQDGVEAVVTDEQAPEAADMPVENQEAVEEAAE